MARGTHLFFPRGDHLSGNFPSFKPGRLASKCLRRAPRRFSCSRPAVFSLRPEEGLLFFCHKKSSSLPLGPQKYPRSASTQVQIAVGGLTEVLYLPAGASPTSSPCHDDFKLVDLRALTDLPPGHAPLGTPTHHAELEFSLSPCA